MNKYDDFFDDNPWENIVEPMYPEGYRLFFNDNRFWVSMNSEGQRLLFVHDKFSEKLEVPDSLAGVKFELVAYSNGSSRLICVLTSCDVEVQSKFTVVTKDIAYKCVGLKGKFLFNKVIEIIKSWANFLKPQRTGLTQAEYIGLLGEFYALVEILSAEYSPSDALDFWVGPEGKNQDFILNHLAIEVKSSLSSGARKLTISSLDQLDRVTDRLFVLHLIFNPSDYNFGVSIKELYEKFKTSLKGDFELELLFFKKTYESYGKASERQLNNKCVLISSVLYEITDTFPCLRKKDIPNSVEGVRYDLLIHSIKEYEIKESIGEIIKNG